ncbi:putative oxidoreductase [Gordonia hirsuta DSM 44140 = NBRC 16056]|uniref:Putative oxidoreductase n=1 Tax=Gordonia hirsuta DSM 44140 = NBRC 16056 TaxID=1121927 RepID=L7LC12_9ACTN|nr:SDR family oxidoreductase [Gordonia hirsuta]GAC58286.1 putative oxidoreductase [Gordonia hirsuta DSM 44140 = NBRC 16056]
MPELLDLLSSSLHRGSTVFVTGGGSGINLGIAETFARTGAKVAICGRTEDKLVAATARLRDLGADALYAVADVRDHDALTAALALTESRFGPVSAVIAGAAGNFNAPAEKISANGFKTVIDIDLLGSFNTAHAAFAQLAETSGSILFVSAGQAYCPTPNQAHAGAAKAGIENLMKNLALEWGQYGIRVNTVVPGPIAGTEGVERLSAEVGAEQWRQAVPLGRFGTTADIGVMAAILASPLGGYVTGSQIVVDGGFGLAGFGMLRRDWMSLESEGARS